jgi:hypothetical protein
MDHQDRQAIDGLFRRLEDAERQAPPRDAEADSFIQEQVARQPGAPYYMAQTIVMQEYALEQAQARISELEEGARARPQGGGLFGGLFGGGSSQPRPAAAQRQAPGYAPGMGQAQAPGFGQSAQAGRGGGFLAGAAQTAMGVAGGVLLGNAVMGMFSGGEAQAAEAPAETPAEDAGAAEGGDEGGMFDGFFGGDDGGDF